MATHPHGPVPVRFRLLRRITKKTVTKTKTLGMRLMGIKTRRQRIKQLIDEKANLRAVQKLTNKELERLIKWNELGRNPKEKDAVIRKLMRKK